MGSRGQKRAEIVDELPADKRACSSLEFRPSTSSSPGEPNFRSTNLVPETSVADMDTSSSNSGSSHSDDEEPDRDSAYGSFDSGSAGLRHSSLRDYQRRRSSGDQGKLKSALNGLSEGSGTSEQIAALTELCEVLSFCTEDSLSSVMVELLSPVLVRLARHDSNPDIMLLAIRALTYLCDVFPRASGILARHDAITALCQRLMAVEYMDVAEQCLQALEIISRDQSLACLQMGAIMAVLSFIDFFPTSVQRVALLTVVNICKNLPKEYPSSLMEAVPTLCNLLQYEDRQLVENVAICLIKIAERASESSEKLDDLCKHGLVNQATCLIRINTRTTLSQPIYNGLIALLVKLSSKSSMAIETLFELDISGILKDILDAHDFSHGITSSHVIDGQGNKVHEVLKLLNELLPSTVRDPHAQQQMLDKESFLVSHPDLLDKFGADILPILSQVVNCGANLYICYGCLSVIKKLVYFSKSDQLVELLKNANIPSFLAGVFTRKDHHVLLLALQITEIILQKHSDAFIHFFVKEGVFFAIETLLKPEKCPRQMFPVSNGIQLPCDSGHKSFSKTVLRCLCYAFDNGQLLSSAESGTCQIETDCVHKLAKHIKTTYVSTQLYDGEKGLTDIFQNFRSLSSALVDLSAASLDTSSQNVEKFYGLLCEIMSKLNGKEPVSTFEFIESGIVKSLANYMSSGWCLRDEVENNMEEDYLRILEERFEVFSRLFSSTSDRAEELPVSILIQKLQCALASLENLPVILNHVSKNRHFVHVPYGRCTSYPCLRVRFKRGEETSSLSDYSQDALTVDPFSTLEAIEGFLLPKVRMRSSSQLECVGVVKLTESMLPPSQLGSNFSQGESSRSVHSEGISVDQQMLQENDPNLSCVSPEKMATLTPGHFADSISENDDQNVSAVRVVHGSSRACAIYDKNASSPSKVDALQKLTFYLEGQPLDRTCTLYQAILQQKIKADDESNLGGKLWNHIYTLTYVLAVEPKVDDSEESLNTTQEPSLSDEIQAYMQNTSFIRRIFSCELASDLDKSTATYDILFLLRVLESLNRFTFHLMSHRRLNAFAEGLVGNLNDLRVVVRSLPQNEFVSSKLTEKLEQQMRDSCAVSAGGMPLWCSQLMSSCPFLFGFEVRCKYFRLVAFGSQQVPPQPSSQSSNFSRDRRPIASSSVRKKLIVYRDRVLESAVQMMELNAQVKEPIEVLYNEEVGTGLGPTLEFYTLVGHEFQKFGLGMWRGDHTVSTAGKSLGAEYSGSSMPASGIFPRPWSPTADTSNGSQFSEVIKKFTLLGQVVAKALQDGRVLDMSFSKAFYKLMLQEELNLYDIQSFDPDLGGTLLEFQAIVNRKRCVGSAIEANFSSSSDACFRNTRIEDLCLDFTLPGYTDYILPCGDDNTLVSMTNLEKYVTLVVDATINAGIRRQVEAFKSGFNLIFPIEHLRIFTEEELERLLCGERDFWAFNELMDHIKLDHGYTVSSPPVVNLLEILQEFSYEQQRGFLQFVTGAPRLPPGGLTSLNPKLTIVRKHCSGSADADLPSVMTCANYLKLPPYSSKEKMKEKLLYAITEGQGSFHLS